MKPITSDPIDRALRLHDRALSAAEAREATIIAAGADLLANFQAGDAPTVRRVLEVLDPTAALHTLLACRAADGMAAKAAAFDRVLAALDAEAEVECERLARAEADAADLERAADSSRWEHA